MRCSIILARLANYLPRFGPYLSSGSNPWGESINISGADADEVRRFIVDCALRWMRDFHADGLRLDAVHALVDTTAIHILEELSDETEVLAEELGRPLSLIAESDLNDPRLITPRDRGGYGMTAQWDDDIHHAIHAAVSGERQGYYADFGSLETLAQTLKHGYFHAGTYSSFRHRRHGRPLDTTTIPATRLLAYTLTHDQVGNRAVGDRPSQNLTFGQLAVKAALALGSPYTGMLSWVKSGGRRRRSSSSPPTRSPSWPWRPPRAASVSSPSTAGTPTRFPTRRTRRPSNGPSCNGTRSTGVSTVGCGGSTSG